MLACLMRVLRLTALTFSGFHDRAPLCESGSLPRSISAMLSDYNSNSELQKRSLLLLKGVLMEKITPQNFTHSHLTVLDLGYTCSASLA